MFLPESNYMPPFLYLTAADVRQALPMAEAIDAMCEAFTQLSNRAVGMPARMCVEPPGCSGFLLLMPCHSAVAQRLSLKIVAQFPGNREHGLPLIQALVILLDAANGTPLAILDGAALTAIRTGAAAGLATQILARPEAGAAAIFGSGVQARTQLEAVCAVRPIREAMVFDQDAPAAARYALEMSEQRGIPVRAARDPAEALRNASVVCCATTSRTPVFDDGHLAPGAHVNGVGSWKPEAAEIPVETVLRARVVVDHRESAMEEAGDLLMPLRQGLIRAEHFKTELGEVLAGRCPGRQNASEITLFKSVGVAAQDLFAANRVVEKARHLGLGINLPR